MNTLDFCKQIIANKYATVSALSKVESLLLKYLKNHKDGYVYNLLGKVCLRQNNLEKAKEYFTKSLKYKELPSTYFGLFKISVQREEFKKANQYLKKYEQINSFPMNVNSYYLLLQILHDFNKGKFDYNYPTIDTNFINVVNIKNTEIAPLYHKCIEDILNKNYKSALENMIQCQTIIIKKNIPLDLSAHIYMLSKISQLYNKHLNQLKDEKAIKLLHTIDILIENNKIEEAEQLLNRMQKINHKHKKIESFLIEKVYNKKHKNSLPNEVRKQVEYYINLGHTTDLNNALQAYINGLQFTHEDIFNYYIGKTLYKLKNYDAAFQYFTQYQGTEKRSKKYHYLLKINQRVKKIKLSKDLLADIEALYKFQNFSEISIKTSRRELVDKYDKKYTKKINMTVNDFLVDKT